VAQLSTLGIVRASQTNTTNTTNTTNKMVMKRKLINKLAGATSAILALSFLGAIAALFFRRTLASFPGIQSQTAYVQSINGIADMKACALNAVSSRQEVIRCLTMTLTGIVVVLAVFAIFSAISLFWLRRLKTDHDA
jgi:predicted membrane-bound spermidine synthase